VESSKECRKINIKKSSLYPKSFQQSLQKQFSDKARMLESHFDNAFANIKTLASALDIDNGVYSVYLINNKFYMIFAWGAKRLRRGC